MISQDPVKLSLVPTVVVSVPWPLSNIFLPSPSNPRSFRACLNAKRALLALHERTTRRNCINGCTDTLHHNVFRSRCSYMWAILGRSGWRGMFRYRKPTVGMASLGVYRKTRDLVDASVFIIILCDSPTSLFQCRKRNTGHISYRLQDTGDGTHPRSPEGRCSTRQRRNPRDNNQKKSGDDRLGSGQEPFNNNSKCSVVPFWQFWPKSVDGSFILAGRTSGGDISYVLIGGCLVASLRQNPGNNATSPHYLYIRNSSSAFWTTTFLPTNFWGTLSR